MALTKERIDEIGYLVLKNYLKHSGLKLNKEDIDEAIKKES